MSIFLIRDLKLAQRACQKIFQSLLFFTLFMLMFPLAIGEGKFLKQQIAATIWLAVFFTILLNLEQLFKEDQKDGSLDIILMHTDFIYLTKFVFLKCTAYFCSYFLPLLFLLLPSSLFLGIGLSNTILLLLSLTIGIFGLIFLGAFSAALNLCTTRSNLLNLIIILPLATPLLIFGVAASSSLMASPSLAYTSFAFLTAISLFLSLCGTIGTALCLMLLLY